MNTDRVESQEYISYQALKDEIRSLKDENQSLKARLEEAEELKRAISDGDLDALVLPGSEGDLIFTLDSADRAYRTLVETMNEGTATLGFDGTILYCNSHFGELLKMPVQAIIGTSIYRFIAQEELPIFKSLLEHNMSSGEVKLQDVKRKYLPVYMSISSLKAEHSPNSWCLVVTDLTEQKKNEDIVASERLARSIIEQCTEAIIVCDTSGRIIRYSESAIDLLGFLPPFQQFENLVNLRLTYGDDTGESIFPVSSALEGSTIKGVEVSFESMSHKLSMLINSTPLRNANGDIIGCVLTLTDITEIKQNEVELKKAYENLQLQSEELQSQSEEIKVQNEELQVQTEELRQTNESLLESEERERARSEELTVVLDSVPAAVWIAHDPQALHITGNKLSYEWLRIPEGANASKSAPEGERSETFRMFKDGVEIPPVDMPVQISARGTEVLNYEFDFVYPDGRVRNVLGNARPLQDKQGNPRGSVSAFIDITERKQNEEALNKAYENLQSLSEELMSQSEELRVQNEELKEAYAALHESEAKYRDLFETVQEVFYIDRLLYDEQGNVIDWIFEDLNPAGFELLGLKDIEDAKGKRGSEVLGKEIASFYLPMIEKARRSEKAVTFQYRSPYADKDFLSSYIVRGDILISAQMDITKLKRMEKALRESEARHKVAEAIEIEKNRMLSVLDKLPVYVILLSPDYHVPFANHFFEERFGKSEGKRCYEYLFQRTEPCDNCETYKVLKTFAPHHWEWTGPDGRNYDIYDYPFKDSDGSLLIMEVGIDITEMKQAQTAVQAERQRLFNVLETLPAMICLLTPDYHYEFTNRSFREKFGEHCNQHCYEHCFGFNKPCEFCEAYKVLETGQPHHWEVAVPDGGVIDVYNFPFTDFDGSPLILEMNIDITESRKAEEAIRLSNIYNRSLIEASLDPLVTIGHDGKITDMNVATELITGYSRNELLGTDFSDYFTMPENAREGYQQVFINGEVRDYPLEIKRKDGRITPVLYNASVYKDENDEVIGVFAAAHDITNIKEAEDKIRIFANAVESSHDAIITQSLDGIILSWNWGAEQIYGHSSEEVIGKNSSILEIDGRKGEIKQLIDEIKRKKKIQHHETIRQRKDGRKINVTVTLSPIYDQSENIVAVSCIGRDITEKIETEKALNNINIARQKEIHHRIKNNLQVISSLLDLQADKFKNKYFIKTSEVLEAFRESQFRIISMALIHEEIHKVGQIDTLNFSNYIEKLADNLFSTYQVGNEGTIIIKEIEEDIFFDMDIAVPLGIITNELISNSLKYAFPDRNTGEIRIELYKENEECTIEGCKNTTYVLSISDDGIGIPEDFDIEDIDSLGLQLVAILVDQLDGELELKRKDGTEFIIIFTATEDDNQSSLVASQQCL